MTPILIIRDMTPNGVKSILSLRTGKHESSITDIKTKRQGGEPWRYNIFLQGYRNGTDESVPYGQKTGTLGEVSVFICPTGSCGEIFRFMLFCL